MPSVISAIQNTALIAQFNQGLAERIFEEVKAAGAKVVMNGDAPECVLLSPEEYVRLTEEAEDARLFALAAERLARSGAAEGIPEEKVWERLGLTQADLDSVGEAEFE